ncbi:conserved membrane hypothetical protein [Sphingomonas sp. EC-HK361]|uniref:hypothetical protein n=1 Tax=Sphingomonas sp. EC-HK361 TaxID=2038397 RepID=UPI0012512C86|nr:hypothetical protein [Sphingomonas sp. EC-HK361]VVT04928.1 conserved membrane hypothetical protein [Sphingomonas sp. EC-HK361]
MTKPDRLRGGTAGILLLAVLLRVWDFGNPVIHVDEQFYLLVGDRMLHGAVPYLDIWDRKPIGLFLLYALFRLLPGDGILAYQFAACASAALTALIVREGARSVGARDLGALAAGAAYLIGLSLLGGRGGQAPVFYNLLMALAGWITLRLPWRSMLGGAVVRSGVVVCLLAGVAIQFKYSPAFEGVLFGCAHVWVYARRTPGAARLTAAALLWALAGALPTLAAIGWYWQRGAFDDFWFANITSILLRPGYPLADLAMRLLGIAAQLTPLVIAAVIAWRRRQRSGTAGDAMTLALAWLMAALIGFFAIGTFFDHYALPLLVPLCIMAGAGFSAVPRTMVAAMVLGLMLVVIERAVQPDDGPGARRVAATVRANSGDECPWVFIGDTITYRLADACLPTPYAFPNLLAYSTEEGATGIDEAAEVRRILAQRPPVIVTSTRRLSIWNPGSLFAVKAALARDYRPVFSTPRSRWRTVVYLRRDRAFRN